MSHVVSQDSYCIAPEGTVWDLCAVAAKRLYEWTRISSRGLFIKIVDVIIILESFVFFTVRGQPQIVKIFVIRRSQAEQLTRVSIIETLARQEARIERRAHVGRGEDTEAVTRGRGQGKGHGMLRREAPHTGGERGWILHAVNVVITVAVDVKSARFHVPGVLGRG